MTQSNSRSSLPTILFESWGSSSATKKKRIRIESKIYFIRNGIDGPIKIGRSSRPNKRFTTLQTANPYQLYLLGIIKGDESVEKYLHDKFQQYRIRGEWYAPDPQFLIELREIIERGYI